MWRRLFLLFCCPVASEAPRADLRRLAANYGYDEVQKLTASDAAENDHFGVSVAIADGTVVIAATGDDPGGSAYVFRLIDGGATYGQVAKLTADGAAGFGESVSIDGATVVVGAHLESSVYVFRTTDDGATYGQVAKLKAGDRGHGDNFGHDVAINSGTIVVGARNNRDRGASTGSAYVFRTTDGGATYSQVKKLLAADITAGDRFGQNVATDGENVAICGGGAVYIFTDGGGTWSQVAKLVASDGVSIGSSNSGFLAIDGATVAVSGGGAVYIFTDDSGIWSQVSKLMASDGVSISRPAISGDVVVAGASGDDSFANNAGSAYVFSLLAPTSQPTVSPAPTTSHPTTSQPTTSRPTSQPTTPQPTPAPTGAPVVAGSLILSGLSVAEVTEEAKTVLQNAIADVARVERDAVTIIGVAAARRRRLQAGGVVVDYKIELADFAAAEDAANELQSAADDTSVIDDAVEGAAKDRNAEAVFAGVTTDSLTYDVVAATDAPTAAPTTWWDNTKKRKDNATLLIVIIACVVAICACGCLFARYVWLAKK